MIKIIFFLIFLLFFIILLFIYSYKTIENTVLETFFLNETDRLDTYDIYGLKCTAIHLFVKEIMDKGLWLLLDNIILKYSYICPIESIENVIKSAYSVGYYNNNNPYKYTYKYKNGTMVVEREDSIFGLSLYYINPNSEDKLLPFVFFTLVLNGMPFITYHNSIFILSK